MRFRFRVRTLFFAMTAIAALVWAYWIALPDWQDFQRRQAFEKAVSQLNLGPERSLFKALNLIKGLNYKEDLLITHRFDAEDKEVEITPFRFKNRWYCLHLFVEPSEHPARRGSVDWTEIRLYRFRPAPAGYQGQTKIAQRMRKDGNGNEYSPTTEQQYLDDFQEVITGYEKTDLGIDFELIFSNPPVD